MLSLEKKTTSGLKWSAIERLITQVVQLAVMLILARKLGPQAFGLIGMLTVFLAISQVFSEGGFSSALIRKTDRNEADFSTAFYFNVSISLLCYTLLCIFAPYIAMFYGQPELEPLAQVIGFTIVINAFAVVQRAKLSIEMDFQTQAKASLLSVAISSAVVLILAYHGIGVWALAIQTLLFSFSNVVLLNIYRPWLPKTSFSMRSFKTLFDFGSKLLISGLLDSVYKNIYQIVIGKQFDAVTVGYFSQANQLTNVPVMSMTTVIQRVTYPMLSGIQDNTKRLDKAYLLTLKLASAVIFPLMFGLTAIAEPLVKVVLGEDWLPIVALVQILSLGMLLYPIHAVNLNLLMVKGRSDLFLKLEVIKKIIITGILFITIPMGVTAISVGILTQSYLALAINTYYTGKLSSISPYKQLLTVGPIWLLSAFSCWLGRMIAQNYSDNSYTQMLINILVSIMLYIFLLKTLQPKVYKYISSVVYPRR